MTVYRPSGLPRILLATLLLAVPSSLLPATAARAQESRRLRRIPVAESTPAAEAYRGELALPTRAACEAAARQIAADYGPRRLEPWLSPRFPYREELVDALDRVGLEATVIELVVESIERVEVGPWVVIRREDAPLLRSECLVDLRARLAFEDPASGRRVVRDVLRGEWRIEFLQEVVP
jgi:hypothetical protein